MNKSLATNTAAAVLVIAGYFSPFYSKQILSTGYFALSGAITNWLAVYMLFDKVPFLYGSGVVPLHFEDFKKGIKNLVMEQFFSEKNVTEFTYLTTSFLSSSIKAEDLISVLDMDKLFDKLTEVITSSSLGGMLGMFGGVKILENFREPFHEKMREAAYEIITDEKVNEIIQKGLSSDTTYNSIKSNLELMIDKRLSELTPQMVKEIVQKMIKKHLGWLVVWGGVFGGIIGLVMSYIS